MVKISVLKIENPSCLWCRVIQGPRGDAEATEEYNRLLTQMNLYYHSVTLDLRKLKPTSLEEGQVCVVYWSAIKSWCRAVVESIVVDSCRAHCFLVDHGEQLIIPSDQIRVALPDFLKLPFLARKFHLVRIKPITLRVSVDEKKAEPVLSTEWDSSATLYLHNLLQVSTRTEVVLLEPESDSTSIELYVTVGDIKICVNDDLVAKKFAVYISKSAADTWLDEADQLPVMLNSSILNQTVCMTSNKLPAKTQPPPVRSQNLAVAGADDWLTDPSTPQSQQHEAKLKTSEGGSRSIEITEEQPSPGSQSKKGSDTVAAKSGSSEDTDSSLAAALTKNLSLFRFLKFLNPDSSNQQVAPIVNQHEELKNCQPEQTTSINGTGQEVEAECLFESSQVEHLTDEETSSSRSVESGPTEAEKMRSNEEEACSRLLEWLNPEPLNPDSDTADDVVVPSDPRRTGILVHSALPVEPCTSLDDAPITDTLRRVLRRKQYKTLSPADSYSWPALARGCNTVIISQNADQPISYLPPILTHILLYSIFNSCTTNAGPIAVLLCPGWEKVQVVCDALDDMKVFPTLNPVSVLLGVGKDEAKAVRISKNCLLLVTTPFSLVRLLSCHCFLFLRLYHLVLDEADQLFTHAPDQMVTILQHFQKVTSSEENASCPQQLVAVAKRWTSHMEGLLANHMPHPCIVITLPAEAALYGDVQQIILMSLESSKISVLLGALDFNPDVGQKTLIVANSAQEVEDMFKAVNNKSAFCLKTHEGLAHKFDFVVQQWSKDIGPGTHVILVTTNECLKCLGIRDATCVVHYGFPNSPKVFGSRLFCMAENFRNLSERVPSQDQPESRPHVIRSVLLISERNVCHIIGVLRYLMRTSALLPSELLSFAEGVHVVREEQKTNRPLCNYLKSFGVCRDSSVCPDRHRFVPHLDKSVLPAAGVIEVMPLYIKTASVFYGRILWKEVEDFQSMVSEMTSYYTDKKPGAMDILEGGLYAVQEGEVFHRVKILSVPDRGDRVFSTIFVRFIDVGKEEEVKCHQILQLPEQFHSLPAQAVEIVLCQLKPVDAETNWHPKVTRAITQKIRGLQHRARVVFSLGNTVFVDPMVRVTQVPGMKTVINEHNVQSEILNTGMGVSNPEHLNLLKALCQESKSNSCKEASHISGSGDGPMSPEVIRAEEEILAEAFRAIEVSRLDDLPELEPCEPRSPESAMIQSMVSEPPVPQAPAAGEPHLVSACDQRSLLASQAPIEQRNDHTADLKSAEQMTSFHPQVHWYQTSDSVMVKVKLMNPESQCCDFYPDRVVYSGKVNGRTYRADLELEASIAADGCCWEMKSNEPVLKLVKQQKGYWERLLRNKSIFVSYDMEHLKEDEGSAPNGLMFLEHLGDDNWSVSSESGSESD
ncbi:putative ATP-dependent RNA helicase TDRD12 isoform X2 [Larimichthys crocea]|uniref:putative ATP-dependent RNA helicase TDRD12 isoform X2 n=1 Tax=Larimichthys crocea TaxID=215358 RepID=UPI000F5F1D66|nr:putative ATP-dependent RNA helicase TDRD12 isoform X2 [Larimichthys crocea]